MDERWLESFLGFSDADLAANRSGRLSSGQSGRLHWSGIWRLLVGPPLLVVFAVIALVAGLAWIAIVALVFAGTGLYIAWRGFAFLVDAHDGAVAYMTGLLHRKIVRGRYGPTYWATIGPVSTRVTPAAYEYLPEGMSCHLYYAPGCRSLLSLEPALAAEPKPDHPFGPDSAHVWDRLRWSWVVMTIGVLGVLIGAHIVATAHPASPIRVGGTISNYVETHGKSTTRSLYIDGDPDSYTPESEYSYTPTAPAFGSLIGTEGILYIDQGTRNVIALDDGRQLYTTDWYLHPDHETVFDAVNGAITLAASVIAIVVGIGLIAFGRRRSRTAEAAASAPALYAPPTVRSLRGLWPVTVLIAAVVATVFVAFALAVRT